MTVLLHLPSEILADIVSRLDVPSAIRCQLVCKNFHTAGSSEVVFKALCHTMGYLGTGQSLQDLRKPLLPANSSRKQQKSLTDGQRYSAWQYSGRDPQELSSYKSLLIGSWMLHHTKEKADLFFVGGSNYVDNVEPFDFKIDHINKVIVASSSNGPRIYIISMDANVPTQVHCSMDIRPATQVEVDQGCVVYSIDDGNTLDITRLERKVANSTCSRGQGLLSQRSITSKQPISKFRLHFPYLLVASGLGEATLYDVNTKAIVLEIELRGAYGAAIHDLDFDEDFIWVALSCGILSTESGGTLQTYCRRTGNFLWELSPQSAIVQSAITYRFPRSSHKKHEDRDPREETHSVPGRQEFFVERYKLLEDDQELREDLARLDEWDAVRPDPKTGCLCLLTDSTLVVIPGYKQFAVPSEGQELDRNQPPLMILHDSSRKQQRKLPLWMARVADEKKPSLSVADGRAAFMAKNGVALVDLDKFLGTYSAVWPGPDDPRGRTLSDRSFYEGKCVNVYTSPYVFKSNMVHSTCVQLTSTHLAWIGTFQRIEHPPVPKAWQEQGIKCEKVYASEQRPTVFWIDFDKMKKQEQDTQRAREDEWRMNCLRACKAEFDRRVAGTPGDGKYTLRSGRVIDDIDKCYEDPMDTIAMLLNIGEFNQLTRWIDWEEITKKKGHFGAAKLRKQADQFDEQIAADINPFNPPMSWDCPDDEIPDSDDEDEFGEMFDPEVAAARRQAALQAQFQRIFNAFGL
ncbi:unnamed protein product [Sympodiomycopsis kandeliae]